MDQYYRNSSKWNDVAVPCGDIAYMIKKKKPTESL